MSWAVDMWTVGSAGERETGRIRFLFNYNVLPRRLHPNITMAVCKLPQLQSFGLPAAINFLAGCHRFLPRYELVTKAPAPGTR